MMQQDILNVIKKLYQPENQRILEVIVKNEDYKTANSFMERLFLEESSKDSSIPISIIKRDLQYQLITENNGAIYKVISQLEQIEENVAIISFHRSELKEKIWSHLSLINTCLYETKQAIEKMAYLHFKQVVIRMILELHFQDNRLTSSQVTDLLKKTTLDYKTLLGYESHTETATANYMEFYYQASFENQTKPIDRATRIECESYNYHRKINQLYKQQISEYLNEEIINYLDNLFQNWHLQELSKDSNSELKIVLKFWKKLREELKKIYQKKKNSELEKYSSEIIEGQLNLWNYQKKLTFTPQK